MLCSERALGASLKESSREDKEASMASVKGATVTGGNTTGCVETNPTVWGIWLLEHVISQGINATFRVTCTFAYYAVSGSQCWWGCLLWFYILYTKVRDCFRSRRIILIVDLSTVCIDLPSRITPSVVTCRTARWHHHWTHPPTNWQYMASGARHIARDKCNLPGNLQTKSDQTTKAWVWG